MRVSIGATAAVIPHVSVFPGATLVGEQLLIEKDITSHLTGFFSLTNLVYHGSYVYDAAAQIRSALPSEVTLSLSNTSLVGTPLKGLFDSIGGIPAQFSLGDAVTYLSTPHAYSSSIYDLLSTSVASQIFGTALAGSANSFSTVIANYLPHDIAASFNSILGNSSLIEESLKQALADPAVLAAATQAASLGGSALASNLAVIGTIERAALLKAASQLPASEAALFASLIPDAATLANSTLNGWNVGSTSLLALLGDGSLLNQTQSISTNPSLAFKNALALFANSPQKIDASAFMSQLINTGSGKITLDEATKQIIINKYRFVRSDIEANLTTPQFGLSWRPLDALPWLSLEGSLGATYASLKATVFAPNIVYTQTTVGEALGLGCSGTLACFMVDQVSGKKISLPGVQYQQNTYHVSFAGPTASVGLTLDLTGAYRWARDGLTKPAENGERPQRAKPDLKPHDIFGEPKIKLSVGVTGGALVAIGRLPSEVKGKIPKIIPYGHGYASVRVEVPVNTGEVLDRAGLTGVLNRVMSVLDGGPI